MTSWPTTFSVVGVAMPASASWVAYALEVGFPRDAGSISSKGKIARIGGGDSNKAITAVIASSQPHLHSELNYGESTVDSRVVRSLPEGIVALAATLYVER